jgi:hypothetical protein
VTNYPLLDLFLTMLWFFVWILWIFLLIRIFMDLFRSDVSGWAKAGWMIFIIILPFIGVLVYLIVHGHDMYNREARTAQDNEQQFREYVRSAAGSSGGTADEISKLAALHQQGVLTDAEFAAQKAKLLGTSATPNATPSAPPSAPPSA